MITRSLKDLDHQIGCVNLQASVQIILIKIDQKSVDPSYHDGFRIPEDTVLSLTFKSPTHNAEETTVKINVTAKYFHVPTERANAIDVVIDKRIPKHSFERMSVEFGKPPKHWFMTRFKPEMNNASIKRLLCAVDWVCEGVRKIAEGQYRDFRRWKPLLLSQAYHQLPVTNPSIGCDDAGTQEVID